MIVVDTNVFVAAYKQDSQGHEACKDLLAAPAPLCTTPFILAEVDYLVTKYAGPKISLAALKDITSYVMISPVDAGLLNLAFESMEKYPEIGLSDASLIALSAQFKTTKLATMDYRHFRSVKPLSGNDYFTLLPEDATGSAQ